MAIKNIIVSLLSNLGLAPVFTNVVAEISLFAIGIGLVIASPVLAILALIVILFTWFR